MFEPHVGALAYAALRWPVFPVGRNKIPLTPHGQHDATTDDTTIRAWWERWPNALVAILTGEVSQVVAVDVDLREEVSGFDTLETEFGIAFHPATPTAHTPSGGVHLLFRAPQRSLPTRQIGPGLDLKGDRGSLILPPGPGRYWDPHLGLGQVELAPMPEALMPQDTKPEAVSTPRTLRLERRGGATRRKKAYATAALNRAVQCIVAAPAGEQEATLNSEAFAMGTLVGVGLLVESKAFDVLLGAARRMASTNPYDPWRPADLERKIRRALRDGVTKPRQLVG